MERLGPYLSFSGRANRQRYWLTSLVLSVALILLGGLFLMIPVLGAVVAVVLFVAFMWASLALAARRLHDRNRSAWWLLGMYLPVFLLSAVGAAMSLTDETVGNALNALSLPFSLWAFIELGCLKGTAGPNRFGPDPLQPVSEVFA